MTFKGGEYSENALFRELKKRVELEDVFEFEQYVEMVDEIIQEKTGYGFFSAGEDLEQLRSNLESRWREINFS